MPNKLKCERPLIHVDFGWKPRQVQSKELDAWATNSAWLVLPALAERPGVGLFFAELEHEYFPPIGPVNDLFQIMAMLWPQSDLKWTVGFIPMRYKPLAEHVAARNGLRLANGFPHVVQKGRVYMHGSMRFEKGCEIGQGLGMGVTVMRFPYSGDNVFTLETDALSAYYENKAATNEQMRRLEEMQIGAVVAEFHEKYADYFQAYQARRGAK